MNTLRDLYRYIYNNAKDIKLAKVTKVAEALAIDNRKGYGYTLKVMINNKPYLVYTQDKDLHYTEAKSTVLNDRLAYVKQYVSSIISTALENATK